MVPSGNPKYATAIGIRSAHSEGAMDMSRFTLVRHSAYAVGGNAAFGDAVEVCEMGDQQT
jgi:hypothetical protein